MPDWVHSGCKKAFTADDWKKVFDVNVFGVQRMIRAVLPHMKERKHGLLIQIASLTGRLAIPFQGPYSPSKWAVEALAELYRVEVSQFGIESCVIEPGGFPTSFLDRLMEPSDRSRLASYLVLSKLPCSADLGRPASLRGSPDRNLTFPSTYSAWLRSGDNAYPNRLRYRMGVRNKSTPQASWHGIAMSN